jgi:hypothetical protein
MIAPTEPGERTIPQSFLDRGCCRCGGREVRYRADNIPLCPCYWQVPPERSGCELELLPEENHVPPTWEGLRAENELRRVMGKAKGRVA